ncbi:MAG: AAA family ATPase [Syntrophales bacterium]|nr:AAA family ATPase [Syntrophales bacterium]
MTGNILKLEDIDLNSQFRRALELMEETDKNIFITGRAGTGKSTLLQFFRYHTGKNAVILAPTGVAAVNVGGQTIHYFFHFKPNVTLASIKKRKSKEEDKPTIYKKLTAIVIDEVSMVRADLLDCVDKFLRLNGPDPKRPFGGVQMIFIGDLYQLPPVVSSREKEIFRGHYKSPYFFSAEVFGQLDMEFVELEKVYRQNDDEFIRLLNAIRNRTVSDDDLALFNRRCDPLFEAPVNEFYISLTSVNDTADSINERQLSQLPGKIWKAQGLIEGEFDKEYLPTALELKLKKGAQIMLLNNDSYGRWINGTIGKVTGFKKDDEGEEIITARLDNGNIVEIGYYTWKIYRFFLKNGELCSEAVGSFTQYPVRLAFAVTIHKSQGKTFEKAVIDVGRGTFAHGQMYVALSRCVSLDGIILKQPLKKSHILMDWRIVQFLTRMQYDKAEQKCSHEDKLEIIHSAIKEKKNLNILYLKAKDEKSCRTIRPLFVGEMEYKGHPFVGMNAYCLTRKEKRVFNVDRILEICFTENR